MENNKYTPVIGLEVHVELKTKSKMFCSCSADYFGEKPNTHTCPVCLGMPGALPVPNKTAIDWCIMIGLALNCDIPLSSKFDRKNYFYPDLPKGYQISQYDEPFAVNGFIDVESLNPRHPGAKAIGSQSDSINPSGFQNDNKKRIRIRRVHMEEDTGKLIHEEDATLIDFNRSGVPLVEIVTEPDFENEYQVVQYLKKLQHIVRYLDVSNADMEKGDMRLEPNISLARSTLHVAGSQNHEPRATNHLPPYKVEVKNINSFRFVDRAIQYEIKRQTEIFKKGETPAQETRGWNEIKQKTVSQRVKEEANDYRYFPEPDIPPIEWQQAQIDELKTHMPELPDANLERFIKSYLLPYYDAEIITREKPMADYFEEATKIGKDHSVTPKQIANVIINKNIDVANTLPAELVKNIVISSQKAEIPEGELRVVVKKVILENPNPVEAYKKGNVHALGPLVGKVYKQFTSANISQIKTILEDELRK